MISVGQSETVIHSYRTAFLPGRYDIAANEDVNGNTRFLIIGDWGGLPIEPYSTPSEISVANAMGKLGAKLNTSFQLALGDNFYFDGVKSVTDPRFEVRFHSVGVVFVYDSSCIAYI